MLFLQKTIMTSWPPPIEFIDFIEPIAGCKVNFDQKALDENEQNSIKTRFAGHCLIWCRTLLSTNEFEDEIHFKGLLNVSKNHLSLSIGNLEKKKINFRCT